MTVKNNFCSSRRAEEQKLFFALPYFRFLPFFFFFSLPPLERSAFLDWYLAESLLFFRPPFGLRR